MLKRRSTLQNSQKAKRNKITQFFLELDRCIQIPNDDKLMIRKKLKQEDDEIFTIFEMHKREKNYHDLQIKLRKIIQAQKNNEKRYTLNNRNRSECSQRLYSQNSQSASIKNSLKNSPQREEPKKPTITFDITQSFNGPLQRNRSPINHQQQSITQHANNNSHAKIKISSINRVNTSLNKSRQASCQDVSTLRELKPSNINLSSYRMMNKVSKQQSVSKIKLKIVERKSPAKKSALECDKQNQLHVKLMPEPSRARQAQKQNISYSSSIKNLLFRKLHDQKEDKILKQQRTYKNITQSDENEPRKIQGSGATIKKPVKQMSRDTVDRNPFSGDNSFYPISFQHCQVQKNHEEDKMTKIKLQCLGYKASESRAQKMKTSNYFEGQDDRYGQFYLKIKNIIDNKEY